MDSRWLSKIERRTHGLTRRPRAVAIVGAGCAAASIEMVFVLPIQAWLGNSPATVFRSIAYGMLGRPALQGGSIVVALGILIHVTISFAAAAAYLLAAERYRVLHQRPVAGGIVFGALVYLFMTFFIVPVSAIGYVPARSLTLLWLSLSIHLFAFGLPISLVSTSLLESGVPRS